MADRLTKRVGDGIQYDNGKYVVTCYPKNNNLTAVDQLAAKLCDLEDKIEQDELTEVRHGRWQYVDGDLGYSEVKCSACGKTTVFGDEDDIPMYCHCGAKMDEKE